MDQLAGVPGFEPGLSVLETDVLTVDTIPLHRIADFQLPDCQLKKIFALKRQVQPDRFQIGNRKSAIGNEATSFLCDPYACGSAGKTC